MLVDASLQFHIINGESINCDAEERFLNTIKCITKSTSSYHPGHVIGNCIRRHQTETRTQDTYHHENTESIKNEISDLCKVVDNFQYNSLFYYDHIKANPYDCQSHLERMSDFLTEHEGGWSKKNRIWY